MQLTPSKDYVIVEKANVDSHHKVGKIMVPTNTNLAKVIKRHTVVNQETNLINEPREGTIILLKFPVDSDSYLRVENVFIVPEEDIVASYS